MAAASTRLANAPLPGKKARSSTRIPMSQQTIGAANPNAIPAEELQKEKNKKLNRKGSTYAAPPAPNPTAGNLRRGSTRMGGH